MRGVLCAIQSARDSSRIIPPCPLTRSSDSYRFRAPKKHHRQTCRWPTRSAAHLANTSFMIGSPQPVVERRRSDCPRSIHIRLVTSRQPPWSFVDVPPVEVAAQCCPRRRAPRRQLCRERWLAQKKIALAIRRPRPEFPQTPISRGMMRSLFDTAGCHAPWRTLAPSATKYTCGYRQILRRRGWDWQCATQPTPPPAA